MLAPNLVREIDWTPLRDVIVFKNLRFHLPTRVHRIGVFKNLHSGERFWNGTFSVTVFNGYVWTLGQNGGKKISFFKQKWIRVDGALLAYVRYERMEHVKMTAQKTWWQSLARSWSQTESCVCGSLRANILVFWYVFGCGRWQVEKGGRKWRFGFTLWLLMSNVSQVALQCDQTNRGHPDKILRQILKLGNHTSRTEQWNCAYLYSEPVQNKFKILGWVVQSRVKITQG